MDIDAFIDALWLEEGLAPNTLVAYRRDLELFSRWMGERGGILAGVGESDLQAYFADRHASTKATTANRRLTVFKRFFRWALREGLVHTDPTLKMLAAKQALRVPKHCQRPRSKRCCVHPTATQRSVYATARCWS